MNRFYQFPLFVQWLLAIALLVAGFYPALLIIEWSYDRPLYALLFWIYLPIGQFSITPFFRLIGVYRYYSPMLLGMFFNKHHIDLHSGGSFDYVWVMRNVKAGPGFRNKILLYHLEGLLNLISMIESDTISPETTIGGTSYFFNRRTLSKMGFRFQKPDLFYQFNLWANGIDLFWMYSLSKGRLAIPEIWNSSYAVTSGKNLMEHRDEITKLYRHLLERDRKKV